MARRVITTAVDGLPTTAVAGVAITTRPSSMAVPDTILVPLAQVTKAGPLAMVELQAGLQHMLLVRPLLPSAPTPDVHL